MKYKNRHKKLAIKQKEYDDMISREPREKLARRRPGSVGLKK